MPNLLKALIVFSVWALLALTSHLLLSNYQSNFCSHIKHSKLAESKTNIGTEFYLVSTLNDTLSKFQSNNNVYKSKLNIDSISFINKLIESLKNDYRLRLKINLNSNFSTSTIERDLITQIESKIKNEITESESLEFNYYNTINKNTIDFKLLEKNKQLIDSIEQSITTKTFYLDIERGLIKETAELISYSELLRQYLQNYTDKSMAITGHTSNDGYFDKNLVKGLNMANSLKDYFTKNKNINIDIKTYSRGEAEPIANKYTEKGKLLNQRIEIKIN